MEAKNLIRLWAIVSIVVIAGLSLFHRYVEDKTPSRSVKDALMEYGRGTKWAVTKLVELRRSRA